MPDDLNGPEPPAVTDPGKLYGRWYYKTYTIPYEQNEHWTQFFGNVADNIVHQLKPRTVLDAGCARGFLVEALRARGVEAVGFDLSEVAIASAPEAARPHVRVGSLTEPIEGRYDLITCIEVIEHLDPADAMTAVANLCAASDAVLLSSTPGDQDEATHVNVQPPERWSQLFAAQGFYRDFRHHAAYLSPWATMYRRENRTITDVVVEYDRAWYELRRETVEQRRALLEMQGTLEQADADGIFDAKELQAENERLQADNERLSKDVLRLRDKVVGKEGELGTAAGRVAELEAHIQRYESLQAALTSRSWRAVQAALWPVRRIRARRTRNG